MRFLLTLALLGACGTAEDVDPAELVEHPDTGAMISIGCLEGVLAPDAGACAPTSGYATACYAGSLLDFDGHIGCCSYSTGSWLPPVGDPAPTTYWASCGGV